jgi:F-type H+-transporting ATPase subunit delta
MAELTTLARPYAKAAFDVARGAKDLEGWSIALALTAAVSKQSVVVKLLESPSLTTDQKATVLTDLCGDEINAKVKLFISVLAENKRLGLLASIQELYENLKAKQEKFCDVKVISAFELDESVSHALAEKLKKVLDSDVSLDTEIDTSLIGGVTIRAGDIVIDGSIKGRLNKLAESLALHA